MDAEMAQRNWEAENEVQMVSDADQVYRGDNSEHQKLFAAKPWRQDPDYFKKVKISTIALLKMVTHAKTGGNIEVMGMLQGKIQEGTFIIMDVYALPVEGTETRVNALNDANEYMVEYLEMSKAAGRKDNIVGWYHSHPGYGCWLSGIDCTTQMLNQQYQEPFLAIVVDPVRTMSAGKVEIGAFRTYPKDHKPANTKESEFQSIPLDKIEDFGVHCKQYYPLEVSFFKSSLDAHLLTQLWNKYWINTISSSALIANREYSVGRINDMANKIGQAESQLGHNRITPGFFSLDREKHDTKLSKLRREASKAATDSIQGLVSEVIKDSVFNKNLPYA